MSLEQGRPTMGTAVRRVRLGEVRAQRVIAETLGLDVVQHDDGSAPSMYDLRVGAAERPQIAIEVVGAVNPLYTSTWSAGAARGPESTSAKADWLLFLRDGTSAERLRRKIGGLVQRMESAGWQEHEGHDDLMAYLDDQLADSLLAAGVIAAYCIKKDGSGMVRFAQLGDGGSPDPDGSTVGPWISCFLRDDARADVLAKLEVSGAGERHVFVNVGFKGAPFATWNYLVGPIKILPSDVPALPPVIDQVWITTGLAAGDQRAQGVRWTGTSWVTFNVT